MTTTLYRVSSGDLPLASDLDQLIDMWNGSNDVGALTLAAPISAPSSASIMAAAVAGTDLGIGTYQYVFTYVVGYKKTNGTYLYGGETLPSGLVTVTTTSGNQNVQLSGLPTAWPTTVVGLRIYRTLVGGSTYEIVATVTMPNATYTDSTADGSLVNVQPPSTNTTGTSLTVGADLTLLSQASASGAPAGGSGTIRNVNGTLWIYNGSTWLPVGSGGGINSPSAWIG